jgi:hypothetical protein
MTPEARRRELAASALVFVLALLPRLYVAIAWAREPVWDGHYYDFGARRIAEGLGYSDDVVIDGIIRWHPWCHYPVGYSGFLALVYSLFGKGSAVAPIANAVVGALLAVLVHRVGLYWLSRRRARLAGVLVALSPELVVYAALLMTEPLASVAPILAMWAYLRDREERPLRGAILAGVALGLGTLVRPQTVLAAPLLGLLAMDPRALKTSIRPALVAAAIATATCLFTVLPWTMRNCRVMDGCAFVSTNAGWNLAIGAFERATGRFETLRATDGCPVVTGQVQQDRCWARVGMESIRRDPARWLSLVPKKLGFTFDHASFPMGYLGEADRARFDEPTKEKGRGILTFGHRLLLVLAMFSAVGWTRGGPRRERIVQGTLAVVLGAIVAYLLARDEPRPFYLVAVLTPLLPLLPLPGRPAAGAVGRYSYWSYAAVIVTHAIFFGEDRYHVVLGPVLALLGAAAFRGSIVSSRHGTRA